MNSSSGWWRRIKQPTDSRGRSARMQQAVQRDAVGRKLKVYHKKRDERFHGTIVGFSEESGTHNIMFNANKKAQEVDLKKKRFRWTDLIAGLSVCRGQAWCTENSREQLACLQNSHW